MKGKLPGHRSLQVCALAAAILLSLLRDAGSSRQILRPEAGDRAREQIMELTVPGLMQKEEVTLFISSRLLTQEEQVQTIKSAKAEIMNSFWGKNQPNGRVDKDVVFRDKYQNGLVLAEWKFTPWNLVGPQGKINQEEMEETEKEIRASVLLTCENEQERLNFSFVAVKSENSETEKILAAVQRELAVNNGTAEQISLPDSVLDYDLQWRQPSDRSWIWILAAGITVIIFLEYEQKKKEMVRKNRKNRMLSLEYPEFVSNLALLIGTGMTVRSAITKIHHTYCGKEQNTKTRQLLSIETGSLLHQLQNGTGMVQALSDFGENAGNPRYKKLSILMIQQLEKGNEEFVQVLMREAEDAYQERKNLARKLGDEAGTRLLIPMMMMLVITLAILMIPAVLQM